MCAYDVNQHSRHDCRLDPAIETRHCEIILAVLLLASRQYLLLRGGVPQLDCMIKAPGRQPLGVFANIGDGQFTDMTRVTGESVFRPRARRGCAFADFNNDGLIDVVTTSLNEPTEL